MVSAAEAWVTIDFTFTFVQFLSEWWLCHYLPVIQILECRSVSGRDAMELILLMRLPVCCLSCCPVLQGYSGQTGWRLQHEITAWVWLPFWDAEDKALFVYGFSLRLLSTRVVMTVVHISSLLFDSLHDRDSCSGWKISCKRGRKSKAEHNAVLTADVIVRGVRQCLPGTCSLTWSLRN